MEVESNSVACYERHTVTRHTTRPLPPTLIPYLILLNSQMFIMTLTLLWNEH